MSIKCELCLFFYFKTFVSVIQINAVLHASIPGLLQIFRFLELLFTSINSLNFSRNATFKDLLLEGWGGCFVLTKHKYFVSQ